MTHTGDVVACLSHAPPTHVHLSMTTTLGLEGNILRRPNNSIEYGTPVVYARVQVTADRAIEKEFLYEPIEGAGNAARANRAAEEWVDAMEKDLGYVQSPWTPEPPSLEDGLVAVVWIAWMGYLYVYGVPPWLSLF